MMLGSSVQRRQIHEKVCQNGPRSFCSKLAKEIQSNDFREPKLAENVQALEGSVQLLSGGWWGWSEYLS